jgi:hypothetical protein
MNSNPRCFVLMPLGRKVDETGATIDFDIIYMNLLVPAIEKAGLQPFRADEKVAGGARSLFEAVIHSDYLVADITTTNPNVIYELGIRHAMRASQTFMVAKEGARIFVDVAFSNIIYYRLNQSGRPEAAGFEQALAKALRIPAVTSPLYGILPGLTPPQIAPQRPAAIDGPQLSMEEFQRRLLRARGEGVEELVAVEQSIGEIRLVPAQFILALFHAYRSIREWQHMVDLAGKMPSELAESPSVQEQLALALNRLGRWEQAETLLRRLLGRNGGSSETYGILGRVYKDRWEAASLVDEPQASTFLDQAIAMYVFGFETDWRDPYPGINAVTLMTLRQPPDSRRAELLPVVRYAVKRRIASGKVDYWDRATLLELAVIDGNAAVAETALQETLVVGPEPWQAETTARNLRLIRKACEAREESTSWIADIESALENFATKQ